MDVHKTPLLAVFDAKQRLEVPLFQRQYVWDEEHQWLPLWEDIRRKFTEAIDGHKDAPHHFLGAMVLDQKQTPTGHVVVRQVIDGQQRLTTLQVFLSAYRDFCTSQNCLALAAECDKFLFNTGMMADPNVDKFKVWPTQLDRPQYGDIVSSRSREELLRRYPLVWRKYARSPDRRPLMVEAYLFFYDQLRNFFLGDSENLSAFPEAATIEALVDECFQCLRSGLMVVIIDLDKGDDPQVIFETLNARGEPLLPADLLRNYIFFRVNRIGLNVEKVYSEYWSWFDEPFWRQEVNQGRLLRPRSDLFMQHFLASHRGREIPIKHLYVEYRHWIESEKPFPDVTAELATLERHGGFFRRILAPAQEDVAFELCSFLEAYDIRTAYPMLLALMDADLGESEWADISLVIESYLIRRAVCNLGTKNYNRIFLALTRSLREDGFSAASLKRALLGYTGSASCWPDDVSFREAWLSNELYGTLNNAKLVHLFGRLNQSCMSSKAEALAFSQQPSVEHILPQGWLEHWPLQDGSRGMDYIELYEAAEDDSRAAATRKRNSALQTLGNLTILSTALNSAQSNLAWDQKRPEMVRHSLLPLNQSLLEEETWDEVAIRRRGDQLFDRAVSIWKR